MTSSNTVDQLAIANVASTQASELTERLTQDGFYVTQIDSSGGILYEATVTLLVGLDGTRLPQLLEHIRECCQTHRRYVAAQVETPLIELQPMVIEAEVGGATAYVLNVERFLQL